MIYLSNPLNQVISNDYSLAIAERNTQIIYDIINNPLAKDFDIMVDVGGVIYLAPYEDDNGVIHTVLDGNQTFPAPLGSNLATWCLTFQYGASFATLQNSDIVSICNFQVEASDKAFLFETANPATRVQVTNLYNSRVSVCWFGAVADSGNTLASIAGATDNHDAFKAIVEKVK